MTANTIWCEPQRGCGLVGNFLTVSQTSHNPVNSLLRGRWDEIGRLRICARTALVITLQCAWKPAWNEGVRWLRVGGVPAMQHPRPPPLSPWVGSVFGSWWSTSDVRWSGSQWFPLKGEKKRASETGSHKHRGQRLKALLFFLRKSKRLKEVESNESRRRCVQNLSLHLVNDVTFFSGLNNEAVDSEVRKKEVV